MAARSDRSAREAELRRLRAWCTTVLQALRQAHPHDSWDELARVVERSATIRALQTISGDFVEWVKGLDPETRPLVDLKLRDALGTGLNGEAAKQAAVLARVRKRGRIVRGDEYRLVLARVDEIHADPSHGNELKALNALLAAFDAP